MRLTYLFLFALSTLLLGFFSTSLSSLLTGYAVAHGIPYHDTLFFTAQAYGKPSKEADGSFSFSLPGNAQSCTFSGRWETDNHGRFQSAEFCHGAQGQFTGYADATTQYVVNDPDFYRWVGQSREAVNPPATRHETYIFWMELCDTEYYDIRHQPRYGVSGTVTGFGTDKLDFSWHYLYGGNVAPQVNFFITADCVLAEPLPAVPAPVSSFAKLTATPDAQVITSSPVSQGTLKNSFLRFLQFLRDSF